DGLIRKKPGRFGANLISVGAGRLLDGGRPRLCHATRLGQCEQPRCAENSLPPCGRVRAARHPCLPPRGVLPLSKPRTPWRAEDSESAESCKRKCQLATDAPLTSAHELFQKPLTLPQTAHPVCLGALVRPIFDLDHDRAVVTDFRESREELAPVHIAQSW